MIKINKRFLVIILIVISCALLGGSALFMSYIVRGDMTKYIDGLNRIERNIIEKLPIYEDFATAEKENNLRKYLQDDHLRAAKSAGISPVHSDAEIMELVKSGKLVKLDSGPGRLYFFYNVRNPRRFLTPAAAECLDRIAGRFQENINKRIPFPPVKIAISSALRSVEYQNELKKRNYNATVMSTHSYGTSFDIFYDEFYIDIPPTDTAFPLSRGIQEIFHTKMGFLLGASLRRQFHAILMETLLQLQDEGILYAILEGRQRCYHVTPPAK